VSGFLDPDDSVELAVGRGLAYISQRDRTRWEVKTQLIRRGYDEPTVTEALARLAEMGYLNDALFCQRFAEDRRVLDGWGDSRIKRRLIDLGIERELLSESFPASQGSDELHRAVELLATRVRGPIEADADRRRAMGLLVRRGYSTQIASDAIRAHRSTVE
jgi:regulatory protein